jgi:hypothetical protein
LTAHTQTTRTTPNAKSEDLKHISAK